MRPYTTPAAFWERISSGGSLYWSGLNTRVYMNGIWIPEVTGIEWNLSINIEPRSGYASYTADRFLRGTRIVQGNLTTNFIHPHYLQDLLNSAQLRSGPPANESPSLLAPELLNQIRDGQATSGAIADAIEESGAIIRNKLGYAAHDPRRLRDLAEQINSANFRIIRDRDTTFQQQIRRNPHGDRYNSLRAIEVVVQYGTMEGDSAQKVMPGQPLATNPNLPLDPDEAPQWKVTASETITRLEISGKSKIVVDDGKPVAEVYSFIAADIH